MKTLIKLVTAQDLQWVQGEALVGTGGTVCFKIILLVSYWEKGCEYFPWQFLEIFRTFFSTLNPERGLKSQKVRMKLSVGMYEIDIDRCSNNQLTSMCVWQQLNLTSILARMGKLGTNISADKTCSSASAFSF